MLEMAEQAQLPKEALRSHDLVERVWHFFNCHLPIVGAMLVDGRAYDTLCSLSYTATYLVAWVNSKGSAIK